MENINEQYDRKNPFTVPEGYFDTLESRIMAGVGEERKPKKLNIVSLLKPYMGLTAVFLMAILAVQFIVPHFIDSSRMLLKEQEQAGVISSREEVGAELDMDFNPTNEEIIEYLAQEVDISELLLSENY